MIELGLILALLLIALIGLGYPLRQHLGLVPIIIPIAFLASGFLYLNLGAYDQEKAFLLAQKKAAFVAETLKSIKSPVELIYKLQAKIQEDPANPKGWYLLGRIYATQSRWGKAHEAFAKAFQLAPEDEQIAINYAENLWQLNHHVLTEESREIVLNILKKNKDQGDALAMLAIDAYGHKRYKVAIRYWQRLARLMSPKSEEAKVVQAAIMRAKHALKT